MIITLKFRIPGEQGEFEAARLGSRALMALSDIDSRCRSLLKYGEPDAETRALAEEIRGMIDAELLDA